MDECAGWAGGPESGSKLPHSKTLRESGSGAGHRGLEGAEFTIRRVEFPRTDKVSDLIGNSELVFVVGEERVVKWWIGYLPILADKKSFWRCGNFPISVSREDFDKLSRAAREGEKREGRDGMDGMDGMDDRSLPFSIIHPPFSCFSEDWRTGCTSRMMGAVKRALTRKLDNAMSKLIAEMLVDEVTMETHDVKTLRLKWPEGYHAEVKTGQFITLYWPDTPNYKRAYSLCSCGLDAGFYEVTVKRDGKMGTRHVDWAKVGDRLGVLPPAGRFLPAYGTGKHLVCLAGGSGVTPFRGFVREAILRKLDTKITVLYSVRGPKDIIFDREFRRMEQEYGHFKFHVTCTRLIPGDPWVGRCGRIDAAWIKQQVTDVANTVFYACGPTALVEDMERLVMAEFGVPKSQVLAEKWG